MDIARVLGTAIATIKDPFFDGRTVLVCQPLGVDGSPAGSSYLAVDRVQAGVGDRVLVMGEGNGARQLFKLPKFPCRRTIVGIVDHVEPYDSLE